MTKRADAMAAKDSVINVQSGVIVVLMLGLIFMTYSLITMRDNFTVTIPPNIQNGAIVNVDEFNTSAVHAFASMTFMALNRWENNGFVDYGVRIEELSPRFTAEYYEALKADMNLKNFEGELVNRTRYAQEVLSGDVSSADSGIVRVIDRNTWVVDLSITIVERISDFEVKNRTITYPLIVRRGNIDPEKNAWGLLIDGYPEGSGPVVVEEFESEVAG